MPDLNASSSITIDTDPATIFTILTDPRQHSRIDGSGTVKRSVSGDIPLRLGSRFRMDMKKGAKYRIDNRVVEFAQDSLIAWRHMGRHRWRYELTPMGDTAHQTRVTETWDVSAYPSLVARILSMGYHPTAQKSIEETLTRLKDAAESDARAAA